MTRNDGTIINALYPFDNGWDIILINFG